MLSGAFFIEKLFWVADIKFVYSLLFFPVSYESPLIWYKQLKPLGFNHAITNQTCNSTLELVCYNEMKL